MTTHTARTTLTIALAGQPNTGKSTIFNALTGMNQEVGNWAGKTVERKTGVVTGNGMAHTVVDLPGTYSLSAHSGEEVIARNFILEERPDLVVVVVNAASLQRTLYYASEIDGLGRPCIIALNMMDVAEDEGLRVDPKRLSAELGIPVVPLVASKGNGVQDLITTIACFQTAPGAQKGTSNSSPHHDKPPFPWLSKELRDKQARIMSVLEQCGHMLPSRWLSIKLMEGDEEVQNRLRSSLPDQWDELQRHAAHLNEAGRNGVQGDVLQKIVEQRYAWIEKSTNNALSFVNADQASLTDRVDRWATHPLWGTGIMAFVLLFSVVMGMLLGFPLPLLLMKIMFALEEMASQLHPTGFPWLAGLLQGIIRGVGSVVSILPFLMVFCGVFAFLEDVGYMARIAYIMDRFMARIGLGGKAFIPLLFALPCNITGALASRIADSEAHRLKTIYLLPLVPCSAKIAVLASLSIWLFNPQAAAVVIICLLTMNALFIGLVSIILGKFFFHETHPTELVLELPHYHRPNWNNIGRHVLSKGTAFVRKASTVILGFSIIIWFISYFPTGEINSSLLGRLGMSLEPLSELMGLDWRMFTSLLASMLNKESALATMAIIFDTSQHSLPEMLQTVLSPASAISFMVAQSLFIPCVATLGVLYSEVRSLKTILGIVLYTTLLPIGMGILVYQSLRLIQDLG